MLKNYLKIALRNLLKNKVYSSINILGLTVGLSCCVLILLYVQKQFTYDSFYESKDDIYRLAVERIYPDHVTNFAITPAGFAGVIPDEIPEVEESVRLVGSPSFTNVVEYREKMFEENYVFFADSNFFNVLDFEIIKGDADRALSNPWSVVLTQTMAEKYFGSEDPIGKTIQIDDSLSTVTAVMQDIPENSHLEIDLLSSSTNEPALQGIHYIGFTSYTYLKITENANIEAIELKMADVVNRYASGQIERRLGVSYKDYREAGNGYNYFLQPITDIHLHSNLEHEIKANGNITYLYILISIAAFILLIACVNFVNLATARSGERALEVGIRKVMGSERNQLIRQFLTESVMISLFSLVLVIFVVQAALPFFNSILNEELTLNMFENGLIATLLIGFTVVVGILAGIYPAFYISSLKPVQVMKGKFQSNAKGSWLRNGLVVVQFAISIILISGTLVVKNQLDFIQNKSLGFVKENILVLENVNSHNSQDALETSIERFPEVESAAYSESLPGVDIYGIQLRQPGSPDVMTPQRVAVEDNYIETMEINLIEGRSFSENFDDSLNVILNQAAVDAYGITDPVGKTVINVQEVDDESVQVSYEIIGVVENFNFESLRNNINPLVILSTESAFDNHNFLTVKLGSSNYEQVIPKINGIWSSLSPDQPFRYFFLEDRIAEMYTEEQKTSTIFTLFASIAIIIACVGLFGLAAYTSYQRTKEIGIRKVLGATVSGIVLLLSKDFTKLVGVAFIIAAPIAYLLMNKWLQSFAFRVDVGFTTLILAGVIALIVALVTIGYQAISVAVVNPVKSLSSE